MFNLTDEQAAKLAIWTDEQDRAAAERQGLDTPYYGACGGELTYSFTPTSLGLVVRVRHGFTKAEINLTEYDAW